MRKFWKDTAGAFAIEFAILCPLLLIGMGQGITTWQLQSLKSNTAYVAQAAANAAAQVLRTGGTTDDATAKAISVVAANQVLWNTFDRVDPPTIVFANGLVTVTCSANSDALFPVFTPTIATSTTVTS